MDTTQIINISELASADYFKLQSMYGKVTKAMADCKKWSDMIELNELQARVGNEIARRPEYRTNGIKRRAS